MGASAKVTTNAPAIPDTRIMMFPLLVLEMKERGERHKGSGGSAQNLRRCRHVTTENLPKLHARFFLMPRPASGRGRAKSLAHPGKRHRAGAHARKSRSCRERFCNHMEGHEKERNQAPKRAHAGRAK